VDGGAVPEMGNIEEDGELWLGCVGLQGDKIKVCGRQLDMWLSTQERDRLELVVKCTEQSLGCSWGRETKGLERH
jgi:hypothetical protein